MDQKTLIFVGAHPDDETFSIGATLAHYASAGVRVYCICATRGEAGTADPALLKQYASMGDLRWAELECAGKELGLTGIIYLGYRDSGMPGSEDNRHPQALAAAPIEEVAGRIVRVFRKIKPQVVITSDPEGGYGHPDHIAIHNATVKAFFLAGDTNAYPDTGPSFKPQKLYFSVFPRKLLRFILKFLPLFGQDPHHMGRNRDIDMASMAALDFPVHAEVRLSKSDLSVRDKASVCYASQLPGAPRRQGLLGFVRNLSGQKELFMRGYPPPDGKRREKDLFEGI